ncbi:targeting protein for Xklp2-like [Scylla paramamosain]|uniref:targeting protein for Xklp2-like n=1 Tax=Scylla paramamosain TaxID=85552 RepID=UPI003082B4A6
MAGEDQFQFNAPTFVDFTKDDYDEVDESYFDLPQKTPRRKTQGLKDLKPPAEEREQPPTEKGGQEVPSEHKEPEQIPTKQAEQEEMPSEHKEPEQLPTEQAEQKKNTEAEEMTKEETEQEKMPTEQPEKTEQMDTEETEEPKPSTEQAEEQEPSAEEAEAEQMATEQEEQAQPSTEQANEPDQMTTEEMDEQEPPAEPPKSVSKDKRRKSLKLDGAGVRQSPRLLAISKALRRSNASRRSSGDCRGTTSTQASQVKKVQPQKRVVPKVSGMSISEGDKEELELVATFRQKITNNKKRKDGAAPNQPFKLTKPQEFHFATDKRLRKQEVEDPAPPPPPPAARSTRSGRTKPQEFTFATDARIKTKESVKEETEAPVEFARSLRSSTLSLNKDSAGRRSPTIPKPFHLSESRKEQGEAAKRFLSMAELSCKNYIRTPEVYRKSKRTVSTDDLEDRKKPRGPTMAVTPNLATSKRRRSHSLMTQEEREQQEFEEAQKHAFKARPVNKRALKTPPNGYRVSSKPQSQPSESLMEEMIKMDSPPKMLVSMLPYAGLPLQGKKMNTKVRPFSFDQRDQERMKKKEEKIKRVLEDEKSLAEFHARPMPLFEGVGVPARKPPTPTQVKPFALNVERRGSIKQEKFKQQLENEAKKDAAQRKFLAQDDSVVHKNPFVPQKSNRPLTEISNVTLSTEVRAVERSEFDQQRKELEEEMLAAKKMAEEHQAAEELAEVTRLRQAAVHKAQPIPKTKPMVLHPTSQMPTVPKSPDFATDSRLRSKSRANSTFNV